MYNYEVRTTIELKPEHRAKLVEIAAQRGEKGFSAVIAEAVDAYLRSQKDDRQTREKALRLRGCFQERDAEELQTRVRRIREHWR